MKVKHQTVSCSVKSNSLRPRDCSPPGSSVRGILQARILEWKKNIGVGRRFLRQGIFLTQGSNPGLLHCTQILYRLSHQKN